MRTDVYVSCRACAYRWLLAILDDQTYWGQGVTPEKIATRHTSCPKCDHLDAHPLETAQQELFPETAKERTSA